MRWRAYQLERASGQQSANMAAIDADELAALRKDRESLNSMATLLAEARRERDALQGRPVKPHRSGGPDAEADYRRSDSRGDHG